MNRLKIICTGMAMVILVHVSAQDSLKFRTLGAFTGYGKGVGNGTLYNPVFFAGEFSWQFGHKRKPTFWAWYVEPQFNLVRTVRPLDYEFGTNMGIRYYRMISPHFYAYAILGSGPHFFSADVARQVRGFLFSDNIGIGAFTRLGLSRHFINTQFRFRHLSNASTRHPNSGINSMNVLLGWSIFRQ